MRLSLALRAALDQMASSNEGNTDGANKFALDNARVCTLKMHAAKISLHFDYRSEQTLYNAMRLAENREKPFARIANQMQFDSFCFGDNQYRTCEALQLGFEIVFLGQIMGNIIE